MPGNVADVTPPSSVVDPQGKTHLSPFNVDVRDFATWSVPPPQPKWFVTRDHKGRLTDFGQVGVQGSWRTQREDKCIDVADNTDAPTPTKASMGDKTPPESRFPEHSTWAAVAEEDVMVGLKRLSMLALDENKMNPTRSVEDYYSERLSKLLRDAELKFDIKKMQ
jgi:hypothetical protein